MRLAQGGFVKCTSLQLPVDEAQGAESTSLLYTLVIRQSHAAAHNIAVSVPACQPAEARNGII